MSRLWTGHSSPLSGLLTSLCENQLQAGFQLGFKGAREEALEVSGGGRRTTMAGADALMGHRVRVMRLYRHSLKQMMSWPIQKSLIYEEFKNIRSQFEANKNVVSTPFALTDPGGAAPEANRDPCTSVRDRLSSSSRVTPVPESSDPRTA